ncbi:MAG: CDP-glycerol glycerophosphotransferase family protein [Treponema sp.]|jgi:hypothetical protein|nr:CDP-glycerol glycerophosphotransferase family protein [Treponema sp.]
MKALYLIYFALLFALPLGAYIDPGTGSMLFSLLTGISITAFFFLKNLFIKIKNGVFFEKKGEVELSSGGERRSLVIYSEGTQYWNVFKPVIGELKRRSLPFAYYTGSGDDPGLSEPMPEGCTGKFIGKGNAAYRFLNFLEADICLMTTPSLDVFQLKRSPGVRHYSHILHMVTDTATYRLFGLDYFDSVLLSGEYQKRDIRTLESLRGTGKKELYVVGCTYLDELSKRAEAGAAGGRTVLVAPSWGKEGILRRYGLSLLEPLAKSSYRVIIRPHPQSKSVEKEVLEGLRERLSPYPNVEWDFEPENIGALSAAGVLISDFSGVIFDYAFMFNRPVVYPGFEFDRRAYDASDIEEELWVFRALGKMGIRIDEGNFTEIEGVLDGAIEGIKSGGRDRIIEELKNEAYMFPGEAGKRTADALEAIAASLKSS